MQVDALLDGATPLKKPPDEGGFLISGAAGMPVSPCGGSDGGLIMLYTKGNYAAVQY